MENSNNGQKKALLTLREKIEQRKKERTIIESPLQESNLKVIHSLMEVPEIKEPNDIAEFDMERYEQLTRKVDALYNNYIVSKQEFLKASDGMAESLKDLANSLDETLSEGTKPRWV